MTERFLHGAGNSGFNAVTAVENDGCAVAAFKTCEMNRSVGDRGLEKYHSTSLSIRHPGYGYSDG